MLDKTKHYHFVGVGGMGMGTIACLLLDKGYRLSGSDIKQSFFTRALQQRGAVIHADHQPGHINGADCIIYSSAIKPDNPELAAARQQGKSIMHRAEVLASLLNMETGITVGGAHGKTTTASMISNMLNQAGFHPTSVIGGVVSDGQYHSQLGDGRYFVAEVDESDGTFLLFRPVYSVITNIDDEHLDYYGSFDKALEAYAQFVGQTRPGGMIFICGDDPRLKKLMEGRGRPFRSYGLLNHNDLTAENIVRRRFGATFDCYHHKKRLGSIQLNVPGSHNILNALAAVSLGLELSVDFAIIAQSLQRFSGVQRRFQKKAQTGSLLVIDDYGHHPNEIRETIRTARQVGMNRVVVAFQPHRYSRTKRLFAEFCRCFDEADLLIMTDIYAASEAPIPGVDARSLCEAIRREGKVEAQFVSRRELAGHLKQCIRPGDLVLTLGAGDIDEVSDQLADEIQAQSV